MIYKTSLEILKYSKYILICLPNSVFYADYNISFCGSCVPLHLGEACLAEQQRELEEKVEKASVGNAVDTPASDACLPPVRTGKNQIFTGNTCIQQSHAKRANVAGSIVSCRAVACPQDKARPRLRASRVPPPAPISHPLPQHGNETSPAPVAQTRLSCWGKKKPSQCATVQPISWEYLTAISGDGKLVLMLLNVGFAVSLYLLVHRKIYLALFMTPNSSWSSTSPFLG